MILLEIKKPTTDGLTDGEARQKKSSHENFTDGIIPSVFSTVITDGKTVGVVAWAVNISELFVKYQWNIPSVIVTVNTDGIYPSVIVAWVVIFLQLSVKYRQPGFVCKAVGIDLKY